MIFANTDKEITLLYTSEDSVGKQILAFAKSEAIPVHDVDLAHTKVTPTQWSEVASRLNIPIQELLNTEGPDFAEKFNEKDDFSEDDWLTVLVHNPSLLKAPVVMKGDKIVMMSNPQDMLQFIK